MRARVGTAGRAPAGARNPRRCARGWSYRLLTSPLPTRHGVRALSRRDPSRARAHARDLAHARRSRQHEVMNEKPRCSAVLRSGAPCRSVATSGAEFCSPHLALAAEFGEDALRRGDYPRRRRSSALVRVSPGNDAPEAAIPAASGGNGNGSVSPADVRPRLAEAAAANLSELERVLVETATGANRQVWTTIDCKHCGREGRYEIDVPDNRVRLDAVEKLLQQGLGRAREAEESRVPRLPDSPAAVRADVVVATSNDSPTCSCRGDRCRR